MAKIVFVEIQKLPCKYTNKKLCSGKNEKFKEK